MLSPYTENFATIGSQASGLLAPGDYLVAGPGKYSGVEEVDGLKVIHSPYNQVWLIGRTVVKDPADRCRHRARDPGGTEARPAEPLAAGRPELRTADIRRKDRRRPVRTCPGRPLAKARCPIGGPWARRSKSSRRPLPTSRSSMNLRPSTSVRACIRRARTTAPPPCRVCAKRSFRVRTRCLLDVKASIQEAFAPHNGWLVAGLGNYGTNYVKRVEADRLGVGAPTPNLSIYPLALTDRNGVKLNGLESRYVVHFPASDFPMPVQAFWSLTLYESSGFFVANPLERYTVGDRSNLHFNGDGSLDIYVQTSRTVERSPAGQLAARPGRRLPDDHAPLRRPGGDDPGDPRRRPGELADARRFCPASKTGKRRPAGNAPPRRACDRGRARGTQRGLGAPPSLRAGTSVDAAGRTIERIWASASAAAGIAVIGHGPGGRG